MALLKITRRQVLLLILLAVLVIYCLPAVLTWAINTRTVRSVVSAQIKKQTRLTFTTKRLHVALVPELSIYLKDITVDLDTSTAVHLESLHLFLDLKSLLHGQIQVHTVLLNNGRLESTAPPGEQFRNLVALSGLTGPKKDIQKTPSPFFKEAFDHLTIRMSNLHAGLFNLTEGKIVIRNSPFQADMVFYISSLALEKELINSLVPEKYIRIDAFKTKQCRISCIIDKNRSVNGRFQFHKVTLQPRDLQKKAVQAETLFIDYSMDGNRVRITLPPATLDYPSGTVGIDFSYDRDRKSALVFSGEKIDVQQSARATRGIIHNSVVCDELFHVLQGGLADHVRVEFTSPDLESLFSPGNFRLNGGVTNASVRIPGTGLLAAGINGQAGVENGILTIRTDSGLIEESSITAGDLMIDLINHPDVPFSGRFTVNVRLSRLPDVLRSLLPNSRLAEELALVSAVQGSAAADLELNRDTGQQQVDVRVNARDIEARALYRRIPNAITIDRASFTYENRIAQLTGYHGRINGQDLYDVSARVNLTDVPEFEISSGTAVLDAQPLLSWLRQYGTIRPHLADIETCRGAVFIDSISVTGDVSRFNTWKYDVSGRSADLELTAGDNQAVLSGLFCEYRLTDTQTTVSRITGMIHDLSLLQSRVSDEIPDTLPNRLPDSMLDDLITPFQLKNGTYTCRNRVKTFSGTLIFPQEIRISLDGVKTLSDRNFRIRRLEMIDRPGTHAVIEAGGSGQIEDMQFSGMFDSQSFKKIFTPGAVTARRLSAFTRNRRFTVSSPENSRDLIISTPTIDMDTVFEKSGDKSWRTRLLQDRSIFLKIGRVTFKKLLFTDIDTVIRQEGPFTRFGIDRAVLCSLDMTGSFILDGSRLQADIDIDGGTDKRLDTALDCLFHKPGLAEGPFRLNSHLTARGPVDDFLHAFDGQLSFEAATGRIYKMTLLSRILSFLNVSKLFRGRLPDITQDGFAFEKFSIDADVKDSRIQIKHAVIDGNDMTLIFSGWVDPLKDEIDLTCLVAPFKSVDMIISRIPVLRTLLDGRLASVPVRAQGSLDDPVIIPLHPASVGQGIINLMVQILKTPVTILDQAQ